MYHKKKNKYRKKQEKKKSPNNFNKPEKYPPLPRDMILQRTLGNQVVTNLFKAGEILAKLYVNQPGDVYEKEADRIAGEIVTSSLSDF